MDAEAEEGESNRGGKRKGEEEENMYIITVIWLHVSYSAISSDCWFPQVSQAEVASTYDDLLRVIINGILTEKQFAEIKQLKDHQAFTTQIDNGVYGTGDSKKYISIYYIEST